MSNPGDTEFQERLNFLEKEEQTVSGMFAILDKEASDSGGPLHIRELLAHLMV